MPHNLGDFSTHVELTDAVGTVDNPFLIYTPRFSNGMSELYSKATQHQPQEDDKDNDHYS
jgi:hypothetical protein